MWHRVDLISTDVSEERVVSSFRVEEIARARKSVRRLLTDFSFTSPFFTILGFETKLPLILINYIN
jgi:hypothetical protein